MNPLRSFFTYIASGILSLRKNFHTLRIYKSEKFVDFALSDGPGGSVVLEIKTNDINDIVKITASLEAAGYCIFKKSVNFKDSVTFEGSIIADSTVEIASHLTCGGVATLKSLQMNGVDLHEESGLGVAIFDIAGRVKAFDVVCGNLATDDGGTQNFKVGKDGKVYCTDLKIYHADSGMLSLHTNDDGDVINDVGSFCGGIKSAAIHVEGMIKIDPHVLGQVWNDGGTLKVSAG